MCVFNDDARSTDTIIFLGETSVVDKLYHTLGYSNTVKNLVAGPNAMLIHFPTKVVMTSANVLNTDGCPHILTDMKNAIDPPQVTRGSKGFMVSFGVEVFDSGIYTIVLASDARLIPTALNQVPLNKRPALNSDLFEFYARAFPGRPIALCCFDNKDAVAADPMLWYYEPEDDSTFVLPGIDCHTGSAPDPLELVKRDHWLLFGSNRFPNNIGSRVYYTDRSIPNATRAFLPEKVVGFKVEGNSVNGDFVSRKSDILQGSHDLAYLQFSA